MILKEITMQQRGRKKALLHNEIWKVCYKLKKCLLTTLIWSSYSWRSQFHSKNIHMDDQENDIF